MAATARDWRVTSAQEVSQATECIRHAQDDADADMLDVLRSCWSAYRAAGAAAGAWTQSMLLEGHSWPELAEALGVPVEDVEPLLAPLIGWASESLHGRLFGTTEPTQDDPRGA